MFFDRQMGRLSSEDSTFKLKSLYHYKRADATEWSLLRWDCLTTQNEVVGMVHSYRNLRTPSGAQNVRFDCRRMVGTRRRHWLESKNGQYLATQLP